MKTCTYNQVETLAAELAGRPPDKLPTTEATMLLAFLAGKLPEIWNREAWPELCDNLEEITLDDNNAFDKREGDADEMGDILSVLLGFDPRLNTNSTRLNDDQVTELDGRVVVNAPSSTAVFVEWQQPAPELLEVAAVDLAAYTLPRRFKLALAFYGAAFLLVQEDPALSDRYRGLAEQDLNTQAARLTRPWWRRGIAP